jgi:hypothetical protein
MITRTTRLPGITLALYTAWLFLAGLVQAHHSIAVFDQDKTVTITGTVKEFSYTNPHG